jgi:hypothetical protein
VNGLPRVDDSVAVLDRVPSVVDIRIAVRLR